MQALFNEIEPFAVRWLRNLVEAGLINEGVVNDRSIVDLTPSDVRGATQAHYFAGIGVWSYALRCAGWPDDAEIWTGSCPCQPFSAAGRGAGFDDARHLWPTWYRLIQECQPPIIVGEQVGSPDGLAWLDLVSTDLERAGYTFGASDLCAPGIGAPHVRQRLYFVAYTDGERFQKLQLQLRQRESRKHLFEVGGGVHFDRLAHSGGSRLEVNGLGTNGASQGLVDGSSAIERLGTPNRSRAGWESRSFPSAQDEGKRAREEHGCFLDSVVSPSVANGFWSNAEWALGRDGKARPIESGTFPLAYGSPSRVGRLHAYGNAIVAPLAQAFVETVMQIITEGAP